MSLSGDRTAGPRRFCRICHVCSARTWSQTHCPACKHPLCARCVCEVPEGTERAHTSFLHHSSHVTRPDKARLTKTIPPTAVASPSAGQTDSSRVLSAITAKGSPHIVINDEPAETTVGPHSARESVIQRSQNHSSLKQHTDDSDPEIFSNRVECDDPMCRATHDGHYPYRHSITCALDRSEEVEKAKASPDNASVAHLPNPLANQGISRRIAEGIHHHHSQTPVEPLPCTYCHHYVQEALPSSHSHRHGHHQAKECANYIQTKASRDVALSRGRPSAADTTMSQSRELRLGETGHLSRYNRGYEASHKSVSHHITEESGSIGKEIGKFSYGGKPIPKGRVFSPPSWLKAPSKEAGDAKSRLRHVNTRSHEQRHEPRTTSSGGGHFNPPRSLSHKSELVTELASPNHDFLRISAPSPPTALHVTQHQRPESLLNHPFRHVHSRESHRSTTRMTERAPTSSHESSPTAYHRTSSRHKDLDPHLRVEDVRYSRRGLSSTLSAHQDTLGSQKTLGESRYAENYMHEHSWDKTDRSEIGSSNTHTDTHTIREAEYLLSNTTSRISRSPPQPGHVLVDTDESGVSERNSSISEPKDRAALGEASDFEIHRPSPIAPPNHDCIWKDRYMAVTAEIRMLKAELSTRASLRGTDMDHTILGEESITNEDEDLGIQGVTIIMHLKGRDDLVINTDLTQGE